MGRGEILQTDAERISVLFREILKQEKCTVSERLGGLTNHTYRVVSDEREYVVRIPGEGTEELISRSDEEVSTGLACELGIDAGLIYFGSDGTKIAEYINDGITMNADLMKDVDNIRKAARIFRTLHGSGRDTGVSFEVFEMAAGYETVIREHDVVLFDDYQEVKNEVIKLKADVDRRFGICRVPCHNDPLCENWILGGERMYLIDWEYAGMNDGMWDLADLSIEAGYTSDQDKALLTAYFNEAPDGDDMLHFMANKVFVDFLWTLWAKTRVPYDGQSMEDWAGSRYRRLKANIAVAKAMSGTAL